MATFPERLRNLEPFWGNWMLDEKLGEGGFSQVFRIKREHAGRQYYAALKWIEVVFDDAKTEELRLKGLTEAEISAYYEKERSNNEKEIDFMMSLRSHPNVVHIDDYESIRRSDGSGYDILIKMELLTPLTHLLKTGITVNDVRQMGMDISKALMMCAARHYVHRDIKPANIFVSEHGIFKLGDFGIGRNLERTKSSMSHNSATLDYMSPEMFHNPASVDTYSDQYQLGLVMYQLLSAYRLPFIPSTDSVITGATAENTALVKRMSGANVPLPLQGGSQLKNAVVKACQFDKNKRFASPEALFAALKQTESEEENNHALFCGNSDAIADFFNNSTNSCSQGDNEQFDIGFIIKISVAAVLVIGLLITGFVMKSNKKDDDEPVAVDAVVEEVTAKLTLTPTPAPLPTPTPTPIPTPTPTHTHTHTPPPLSTPILSLVVNSATVFRANASSTDINIYNHEYRIDAAMAVDGDLTTAWNEGAEGDGIGEWIMLTPIDGEVYTYSGFYIANGFQFHNYHKGDRWSKNNRVASLRVYANGSDIIGTFQIPDLYDGYSTIVFPEPVKCKSLMFEIQSVWSGNDSSDTCISEIRPF